MATNTFGKKELTQALVEYMTKQLHKSYDEEVEKLMQSFEEQREDIIAKTALRISKYMNIDQDRETIRIEIQKIDPKGKV